MVVICNVSVGPVPTPPSWTCHHRLVAGWNTNLRREVTSLRLLLYGKHSHPAVEKTAPDMERVEKNMLAVPALETKKKGKKLEFKYLYKILKVHGIR